MAIEDILLEFVGWPALGGIIAAAVCAKYISQRHYAIIFFGVLGALFTRGILP
ncbi:MAG: hypothetical protein PHS47_00975 [Methanocellales archaeon]|nr:hypothetical protein [Methanocellales archaeon]